MALPTIPNIALGRVAELCNIAASPTSNQGLVWILLKSSGLEADTVLRDYHTVSALLAAANDEATFTGYSRQAVTAGSIAVTTDDSGNTQKIDITTDPSWNPTSAEAIGAIILAYDPDTTSGTDTTLVPLFIDAASGTTGTGGASTPFTYQVASVGFFSATQS